MLKSCFSQVFKGLLDNSQTVAIKYLTTAPGEDASATQLKYFESEIEIMKACRFPTLVTFLGCWLQPVCQLTFALTRLLQCFILQSCPQAGCASAQPDC